MEDNIESIEPDTALLSLNSLIQLKSCLPLLPGSHDGHLAFADEEMSRKIPQIGEPGYASDSGFIVCGPQRNSLGATPREFAVAPVPSLADASEFVEFDSQSCDHGATTIQNVKREAFGRMVIGAVSLLSDAEFDASEVAFDA